MKKFGLIGFPLSHSFSQKYFSEKFKSQGIQAIYENYSIENIDELNKILEDPSLHGLNVTIPYKESVLAFLDVFSDVVNQVKACNCIRIIGGKLYGYNTDIVGFEKTFERHLQSHHSKALVLGSGGASKAVCYVLWKKGIDYRIVSRNPAENGLSYSQLDEEIMNEHSVIINTTPIGMYPHVETFPDLPYEYIRPHHYLYDLIYNPEMTAFLMKGKEKGAVTENGRDMLIIQAEESWSIWNS